MLREFYHVRVKDHYGRVIGVEPFSYYPTVQEILKAIDGYEDGAFAEVATVYNKM